MSSQTVEIEWRGRAIFLPVGTLLIRPPPQAGEHPLGYMRRLAHVNGLENPRWLEMSHDGELPKGHGRVRWCPYCLAETNSFWRDAWETGPAACHIHRCWLVDRCSHCSRDVVWTEARFLSCHCGHAFTDVSPEEFSADLIAVLDGGFAQDIPDPLWSSLDQDARWRILRFLGALDAYGLQGKPFKKASSTSVDIERQLVTVGASILVGGLHAYHQLLDRIRAAPSCSNTVQVMSEAFPRLSTLMTNYLGAAEREWLLRVVNAYIKSTVEGQTAVVWKQRHQSRLGSAQSCARQLKVRPERISTALSDAGVEPKARHTKSGRKVLVISGAELELIERGLTRTISPKATARRFGLSPRRQRLLLAAGMIRSCGSGIDSESILGLMRLVTEGAELKDVTPDADLLSISWVFRCLIPVSGTIQFINALLSKEIQVIVDTRDLPRFHGMFVSRRELDGLYSGQPVCESTLTIPQAAVALQVKQEVMYHLVNVGLVKTIIDRSGRRPMRVITQSEFERFCSEVEPLASAAFRAGVNFRSGLEWATQQGLVLISGPSVDGGRQYFVSRSRPVLTIDG